MRKDSWGEVNQNNRNKMNTQRIQEWLATQNDERQWGNSREGEELVCLVLFAVALDVTLPEGVEESLRVV